MSSSETPSIYSKHFENPEHVAQHWSEILENHLGIRQAKNCVQFNFGNSSNTHQSTEENKTNHNIIAKSTDGCALPPGWTVDYAELEKIKDEGDDHHQENNSSSKNTKNSFVLKSLPPKTSLFPNHPKKGDCLVANQNISAGTTIITEPSLLSTPQEPSLFLLAAASAKAIEKRSKEHLVVSRAAAAAAALIQVCYRNTSEDDIASTSQQFSKNTTKSTFGIFRSVCPQWAASLVFTTLVRIGLLSGNSLSSSSFNNNDNNKQQEQQQHHILLPLIETCLPGWEVTTTFSACSCGGEQLPMPTEPGTSIDESNLERLQDAVSRINSYRDSRWAEWLCAAKMIQRFFYDRFPRAKNTSAVEIAKRIYKLLTTHQDQHQYNNSSGTSSSDVDAELLCALALDLNGFLSSSTLENFVSNHPKKNRSSLLNMKSMMTSTSSNTTNKPAIRLAYFFDAVSSNCIEVSIPGIPKRLAVFSHARLCEHECRPACSVSFLDAPTLHSSSAFISGTQLQWDDAIHGCLVSGGLRQKRLIEQDKKKGIVGEKSEISFMKSSAGHDLENYGGGAAVNLLLVPSVICVSAVRDIPFGDGVSIQYTASTLMTRHERQRDLISRYGFKCSCIWCVGFAPDLARAFRCPKCPKGQGVVCPRADGSQLTLWECIQCGHHPDVHFIDRCCDSEAEILRSTSSSASFSGDDSSSPQQQASERLRRLVDDEYLHYSHAHVCRKLDLWAEKAFRQQDAELCISIVEVLLRCIDRLGNDDVDGFASVIRGGGGSDDNNNKNKKPADEVQQHKDPAAGVILPFVTENRADRRGPSKWDKNPPRDIMLAQYLELLGKANHAIGNAHTSRYYYSIALAIRERSGQALSWWCRATRFMAVTKSLADLMDSK